jgi:cytochrome c peroxidase
MLLKSHICGTGLLHLALLGLLSTPAAAQSTGSTAIARAADEMSLSDTQLLGKRLFDDKALSEPRGQACASCHAPSHAFQGNNGSPIAAIAVGSSPDKLGTRKTPTLMYKAFSPPFGFYRNDEDGKVKIEAKGGQFWDGRAANLVEQVTGPLLNPKEMADPSIEAVVEKIKTGPYAELVTQIYGTDAFADPKVTMSRLADALVTYEISPRFAPFSSKFDDYLRGKTRLGLEEMRGYRLFVAKKKGNCIACHDGKPSSKDPTDWLFTDFTYDALGVPRNAAIPVNAVPTFYDLGLCKRPGLAAMTPKGVRLESLCGAFKVPTLRNVAVTGPYFHNGAIASLRDAVAIYATRDTDPRHWYPKLANGKVDKIDDLPTIYKANVNIEEVPYDRKPGQRPRLSDQDIDALVAFLNTLTDKGMR